MADDTHPAPFVFHRPSLTIGETASAFSLECVANSIGDTVAQDSDDWATFCDTGTTYGPAKRTLKATVYVSYGTDGTWEKLHALEGQSVPFTLRPDGTAAVSATNPEMTGTVRVPAIPFIGDSVTPGKTSTVDLELSVSTPAWSTTATP